MSTLDEFAGPPHSLVWRGCAVVLRAARREPAPRRHAHFTIQLNIGLRGTEIVFGRQSAAGWLIGSDQPHGLGARGSVIIVMLDPATPGGRRAAARVGEAGVAALGAEECAAALRELEACWQRGWTKEDLRASVGRALALLSPADPPALDSRVQAVLDELGRDAGASARLADLAAGVGLSESRLAHLFRREVGLPMRQYRLGLRMEEAFACILRGDNLTTAAHAAGFSDSAHFCRVSRRMFGMAPSGLPSVSSRKPRPS